MNTKEMPTQEEVNDYLDDLRDSGETNMFGAGPYVAREFGIDLATARSMCVTWMMNFGREKAAK